jgi:hypothetical protein
VKVDRARGEGRAARRARPGRFALFQTDGKNWMIYRMGDGPEQMPQTVAPMKATLGELPPPDEDAAFG